MVTVTFVSFLLVLQVVLVVSKFYNKTFVGDIWSSTEIKEKNEMGVKSMVLEALKQDGMEPEALKEELTEPPLKKSKKIEVEGTELDKIELVRLYQDHMEPEGMKLKITEPENMELDNIEPKAIGIDKTEGMKPDNTEVERLDPDKSEQERKKLKLTEHKSIKSDKIESVVKELYKNNLENEPKGITTDKMEPKGMPDNIDSGKIESGARKLHQAESDDTESEEQTPNEENIPERKNVSNNTNDWLIVGGRRASLDDFPFQAAVTRTLNKNDYHALCGGSIVTDRHILTAAHCVTEDRTTKSIHVDYIKVIVGSRCLYKPRFKLNTAQIFVHYCYDPILPSVSDVAVVKTKERIEFSKSVFFVKIPTVRDRDVLLKGQESEVMCAVAGWGTTSGNGERSNDLLFVTPHLITIEKCKQLKRRNIKDNVHLCAFKPGNQVCKGDSGGGLVCNLTGIIKVYGVVSFGVESCSDYPSVYARVDSHYKFIQDSINGVDGQPGWVAGFLFIWTIVFNVY